MSTCNCSTSEPATCLPWERRPTTSRPSPTWAVALEKIREQTPDAVDLLALCSFLAPDDIPRSMLLGHPDVLPQRLQAAARDRIDFQQALGALTRFSLATAIADSLSVHRLVQAVVRGGLDQDGVEQWTTIALRLVLADFPDQAEDVRAWPTAGRLVPHAVVAANHADLAGVDPTVRAALLHDVGHYLRARADHAQAKLLQARALQVREDLFGRDHPGPSPRASTALAASCWTLETSKPPETCTGAPWPSARMAWAPSISPQPRA